MIKVKSLKDPVEEDDGVRVLIARYRPRYVKTEDESWDHQEKRLAPSVSLLDAWYGRQRDGRRVVAKGLPRISWEEYARRFREDMDSRVPQAVLRKIVSRSTVINITLLCHCQDEAQCHRSLVKEMVLKLLAKEGGE